MTTIYTPMSLQAINVCMWAGFESWTLGSQGTWANKDEAVVGLPASVVGVVLSLFVVSPTSAYVGYAWDLLMSMRFPWAWLVLCLACLPIIWRPHNHQPGILPSVYILIPCPARNAILSEYSAALMHSFLRTAGGSWWRVSEAFKTLGLNY